MSGFVRIAVVLVVAAIAAVVANFALLGVATSGDPVGRLSPRGGAPAPAVSTVGRATPPAPRSDHEHRSDD
jgi:hypothetical protein